MRKAIRRAVSEACALGLVVALTGCDSSAPSDPTNTPSHDGAAQMAPPIETNAPAEPQPDLPAPDDSAWAGGASNDGGFAVRYRLAEPHIPLNEPFALDVWLLDAGDPTRLIEYDEIFVDARMPHHRHGMNRVPVIERADDGLVSVEGMLFHMPGYWELYFDVTRGGVTERAQFALDVE